MNNISLSKEKSMSQSNPGFGELCNTCKNQTDVERGFDLVTRCVKAGMTKRFNGDTPYLALTDLTKYADGSYSCSDYANNKTSLKA